MLHLTVDGENTAALCNAILDEFNVLEDTAKALSKCQRYAVCCRLYNIRNQKIEPISPFFINRTVTKESVCSNEVGNCGCIHTEPQAIIYALTNGRVCTTLVLTHSPCVSCANLIAISQTYIDKIFYAVNRFNISSCDAVAKPLCSRIAIPRLSL